MEDSKTLVAARELYNEQMVNALTPALIQHINTIEQEARQNSTPKTFLKAIQELCRQIPQWNQHVLDNEVKKILRQTEPGFLDDLLPAIFVSNAQILSSVSLHGNTNKINLKIPKLAMFIHTVYIELARKLFKQVYLFCDKVSQTQKQMNKHLIEQLAKESVSLAVAKLLPVHDIIKACVLSDAVNDVEESSQHGGEKADSHEEHNSSDNGPDQDTNSAADLASDSHNPETDAADSLPTSSDLSDITAHNEASEPDENADDEKQTEAQKQESGSDKHDSEHLKPADVALPDDDSISDGEASHSDSNGSPRDDSTKGGVIQSPEREPSSDSKDDDSNDEHNTESVERPDNQGDSVDPNENDDHENDNAEQANKSTESPEEIVIDIGLSDDDCMRAKDDDGVLLSYDSDVNATRLQPTPTPFHPKQQAGSETSVKQKQSDSSQPEEDNDDDEDDADKDDKKNSSAVHDDENAEDSKDQKSQPKQTSTTEPYETDETLSAVKLSETSLRDSCHGSCPERAPYSFTADPDVIKYQNNDSTDLSDNDMDYNFTDDELFSDDDEVSRIIYDMKAKQMADDRDTVAKKLFTKESKVEPEPDQTSSSKPDSQNSSMDVFLGDMAPKQMKKVLSTKSVELPIEPQNKTDRRASMTKRFEKRRAHQKVDPVIFDYNTDSDQDDLSSPPPFSNLPQQNKKNHNRKRVTLLPDAASDSE